MAQSLLVFGSKHCRTNKCLISHGLSLKSNVINVFTKKKEKQNDVTVRARTRMSHSLSVSSAYQLTCTGIGEK